MVNAVLAGRLDDVPTRVDPFFGFQVPTACPDVPSEVLTPEKTWSDRGAYHSKARELAGLFHENFAAFEKDAPPEVVAAGPEAGRSMGA